MEGDAGRTRGLTVAEAAEALGITTEAVRKRIARGTLTTFKEGGTVYILLSDADRTREDTGRTPDRTDLLIATLQQQLEAERRANEENRRIIAALTQRIPALEAPSDSSEDASESAQPRPDRSTPTEASGGPQTAPQRPWWRRIIGG